MLEAHPHDGKLHAIKCAASTASAHTNLGLGHGQGEQGRARDGRDGSAIAALRLGLNVLLRLFAPVLPFITEELYHKAVRPLFGAVAPQSVHIAPWPQDEATGQIDLWGGQPSAQDEATGAWLCQLVGAVRTARTAQRLGGGRPLEVVYLNAEAADVARVEADLRAGARAERVVVGELPAELESFPVGDGRVQLAVVPAPETAPIA